MFDWLKRRGMRLGVVALMLSTAVLLSGCAPLGPSVIKTYSNTLARNSIGILRADQSRGLTIDGCDGNPVMRGAKSILLEPGRHEIHFMIFTQTLAVSYTINNKMFIDVEAGHTYILASKGAGFFFLGDKWFPDVKDVTSDPALHLTDIPEEERK